MKVIDYRTTQQLQNQLLEDYLGLIKDNHPMENYDLMTAVLGGQIKILCHVLDNGNFDPIKGRIVKQFKGQEDVPKGE